MQKHQNNQCVSVFVCVAEGGVGGGGRSGVIGWDCVCEKLKSVH